MIATKSPPLMVYRGWEIWKWTGWKGNKVIAAAGIDDDETCSACGQPIKKDDVLFRDFMTEDRHWTCVYPDNRPERLVGQWLAIKNRGTTKQRHAAVMVGGPVEGDCEYERGQMFNIGEEALVTELTPESERNQFIKDGLTRMYQLINRLEDK
jgi:hypothetical protein